MWGLYLTFVYWNKYHQSTPMTDSKSLHLFCYKIAFFRKHLVSVIKTVIRYQEPFCKQWQYLPSLFWDYTSYQLAMVIYQSTFWLGINNSPQWDLYHFIIKTFLIVYQCWAKIRCQNLRMQQNCCVLWFSPYIRYTTRTQWANNFTKVRLPTGPGNLQTF